MKCEVCLAGGAEPYRAVEDVAYFRCPACGSLFADPAFLARVEAGAIGNYSEEYWAGEMKSARERCFGPALVRVAETLFYARRPVRRFLDVGAGSGLLLDAIGTLLPEERQMFHAVELFPPEPRYRTTHPNYRVGTVADMDGAFDAGVCIEVIEHLTPATFRTLGRQLAERCSPGAVFYFNSGQPDFVALEDPGYLDPHVRGHVVSYSVAGARAILEPAGFNVIALPGRAWAFLAELGPQATVTADDLLTRLWTPDAENMAMLARNPFGELVRTMGIESARGFLEHAICDERMAVIRSLQAQRVSEPAPPAPRSLPSRLRAAWHRTP